jgi:16S rRNA (guanine(966)-N(2))-methyltransferase RsmD
LVGINVLDLFSGTGSISFEFISRGANTVHSVDSNFKAFQFVKNTSTTLGIKKECHKISKYDAIKFLVKTEDQYELIFADPPFDFENYEGLLMSIKGHFMLKPQGLIIIEHAKSVDISHIVNYQKSHTFGHVCFSFFTFDHD